MPDSARFALHRPEIGPCLERGDEAVARLMAACVRTLGAGTVIIETGEEHGFVYRVRAGWVSRVRPLPDGRSQLIAVFLPGDLVGVKSMFVTRQVDAVEAVSEALVERIDQRALRDAAARDFDVSLRLTWQVVEDERRLHNWVVGLGRGNAEERMALLLLDLRGRLALAGQIDAAATEYDCPMTQQQVADLLGLTNVHVSRVLRILREEGIATMRSGRVQINDLARLEKLAYPLQDIFEHSEPAFGPRGP